MFSIIQQILLSHGVSCLVGQNSYDIKLLKLMKRMMNDEERLDEYMKLCLIVLNTFGLSEYLYNNIIPRQSSQHKKESIGIHNQGSLQGNTGHTETEFSVFKTYNSQAALKLLFQQVSGQRSWYLLEISRIYKIIASAVHFHCWATVTSPINLAVYSSLPRSLLWI